MQYESCSHSSQKRNIIDSTVLFLNTDNNNKISIRLLVIERSLQWVVGKKLTWKWNLKYIGKSSIRIPHVLSTNHTQVYEYQLHCHITVDRSNFTPKRISVLPLSTSTLISDVLNACTSFTTYGNWLELRRIFNKVHKHICGYFSCSDMRTLLQRKNWNEQVQSYLSNFIAQCPDCNAQDSPIPPPNCIISLTSLNRQYNEVLCMVHLFLDMVTMFHMMDVFRRSSVGAFVDSTTMENVTYHMENLWFAHFRPPNFSHVDGAFQSDVMEVIFISIRFQKQTVPPRRLFKTSLEPRHRTISSIFLRLKDSEPYI